MEPQFIWSVLRLNTVQVISVIGGTQKHHAETVEQATTRQEKTLTDTTKQKIPITSEICSAAAGCLFVHGSLGVTGQELLHN